MMSQDNGDNQGHTEESNPTNNDEYGKDAHMNSNETQDTADNAADAEYSAMKTRIADLESALEEAKQETLYALADTQNVRRRLEKQAGDARKFAATAFAHDMLSVADNLARALSAIPEDLRGDEKWKGLISGIEATGRELDNVFNKNGISKIPSLGETLDPNQHQAMMEIPDGDAEPGTIVQEMQAGYMIHDRLLRAALVGVSKKPD